MGCKYCKDELCVNDQSPLCGDLCPVIDVHGLCRYEALEPLGRFVEAQSKNYAQALKEIKAGRKLTHWMWYIFPQYKGLGASEVSRYYAIQSKAEAKAYMEHPLLGRRLRECMTALLDLNTDDAAKVFGAVDAQKLKSCMTLFYFVCGVRLCGEVLNKFFHGDIDAVTVRLLIGE